MIGLKAIRHRPEHLLFVEDVDILVDDDHVFQQHIRGEGGADRVLRLTRRTLGNRNIGVKTTVAGNRHADVFRRRHGLAHGFEQRGFARYRTHQLVFRIARVNVLENVIFPVRDRGDFDDLAIVFRNGVAGEFAERSLLAPNVGENLAFDHHLRVGRN